MKKFEVTITETLMKKISVEALTQGEAEQIVTDDWYRGEHILDADDFTEINFEAKECIPEKIKVVLVEPGKIAKVQEIDSSLESMQNIVGGNIDIRYLSDGLIIHNREGKLLDLPLNRGLCDGEGRVNDIISGTFFICDSKDSEFISLSDTQITEHLKKFKYPEKFFKVDDRITKVPYNPIKKEHER